MSYENPTANGNDTSTATPAPDRWRLDEVRRVTDVASYEGDDLDAIGARVARRYHSGGAVTAINRPGDTPGIPGFDY